MRMYLYVVGRQARGIRLRSHGGMMGAVEGPRQLVRAGRRGRVATRCTHWQKRRALPVLRLRRFLARFADGAAEPIVGQRPVRASKPFVTTLGQDKETKAWLDGQSRKQRHALRAKIHMESKAMGREDGAATLLRRAEASEAHAQRLQQIIQDLEVEARIVRETKVASRPSTGPLYRAGQSVLQWWASWFKSGEPRPKGKGKKKRPRWYSGEIVHPPVWAENTLYAGFTYTGWLYPAY